ncbi:hypothetical protein N7462_001840 [Penicillium macrosclerotiorum]|uniref:uncharacterized protein n=1 Tax=Penicillium macrosclerotiorum TaxID=303699 RepID=UPI002548B970|nr:uncharacterized protein N7462_001840 [Penicillium macrosclerotiorum]KAJ5692417.1 hypothetical protein N7462_001840 [Penicillium macrosclerotiorum]
MLGHIRIHLGIGLALFCTKTLAVNCTSPSITSEADAETVRQGCNQISGNLTIGPFSQNASSLYIDLDGIETIQGSLLHESGLTDYDATEIPFSVSSTTLVEVGGDVQFGDWISGLTNLTLPNLGRVNGAFYMGVWSSNLTYLDITSLESVNSIWIGGRSLTTMHHTRLRNASSITVDDAALDSVDSLFNNPLNITGGAYIWDPLPNMNTVTIGFNSTNLLAVSSHVTVIFGGSNTTEMYLETIEIDAGSALERGSKVQTLKANSLQFSPGDNTTSLNVPFDDLQALGLRNGEKYEKFQTIRLPAQAVNYTGGFQLNIDECPYLNLSSMYSVDDSSNQTWYWPTNISSIYIYNADVSNSFL